MRRLRALRSLLHSCRDTVQATLHTRGGEGFGEEWIFQQVCIMERACIFRSACMGLNESACACEACEVEKISSNRPSMYLFYASTWRLCPKGQVQLKQYQDNCEA